MRHFAATVAAGLAVVVGFNAYVDPASRFFRRPAPIRAAWSKDECLIVPHDFDDRAGRVSHIAVIDRPDLVFLGSSRVMMADGALLPGAKVYNAGVSGATAQDYAALWQQFKRSGKVPRQVILFVDPWVFNRNASQWRWRSNVWLVEDFLARLGSSRPGTVGLQARLLWEGLEEQLGLAELADLLSWSVLKTSLRRAKSEGLRPPPEASGKVVPLSALPDSVEAWRADGSFIYSKGATGLRAPADIRRIASDYAWQEDVYSIWHFEFDEDAYRLLELTLGDMRASGAEVLMLIPPYQPTVSRILAQRPAYQGVIPTAEAALKRLSAGKDGVAYCDGTDAAAAGCDETEFMDAMHMQRSCLQKVLYRCLDAAPGWNVIRSAAAGAR